MASLVNGHQVLFGFGAGILRLAGHGHKMDRQDRLSVQLAVVLP
jgi:hypothetical protein